MWAMFLLRGFEVWSFKSISIVKFSGNVPSFHSSMRSFHTFI